MKLVVVLFETAKLEGTVGAVTSSVLNVTVELNGVQVPPSQAFTRIAYSVYSLNPDMSYCFVVTMFVANEFNEVENPDVIK